jgi:hypothetical protein
MSKSNLLVAAAIAGLIGGTSLAIGQGSGSSDASSGGAGAAAPSSAERSSPSRGSTGGSNAKQSLEQQSGKGSSAAESKSSERHNNQSVTQSGGKPGQTGETVPTSQSMGQAREGHSGAAASSASAAKRGSASLTSEQRTKIHQTIVRQGNAPRVANVNFSVSVGTTVPRSVRLVAVPAPIVEIQPAWRGYEYFMVGDQVVIVDPDTMQIVAIISA